MREIRTRRAMWRALETGPRRILNGHEEGNLGHKPRRSLRATAPVLDPTRLPSSRRIEATATIEIISLCRVTKCGRGDSDTVRT